MGSTIFIFKFIFKISIVVLIISCNVKPTKYLENPYMPDHPTVFRTDFSDNKSWESICKRINAPDNKYGYKALVNFDDNIKNSDKTSDKIKAELRKDTTYRSDFFFVVDSITFAHDQNLIMCVQLTEDKAIVDRFRLKPKEMWVVENNLSTYNILFEEILLSVNENGVLMDFED